MVEEVLQRLAPPRGAGELGWLGPFCVLKVLGHGGMGVVFEARDEKLQRGVALKVMAPVLAAEPAARQRFVREARAMAAIEHEHVVTIFQVGGEEDLPYLAMQLLRGESLSHRLERQRSM